ncbi:metallopeptidase [Dendryphion nanum]|uniref:Metallopeptidase n=1 Tax=Dendryphion nanum TaxID=256645 RepID=A0A9P9II18_9PLEO|nr:metallopeptidase [Dendryphion nanum]
MVAKDSPLIIDCPPSKRGGFSSTHSDLDAAIAKLRMTAYMWQAMTAEDLRMKGLGRRSFRLDEEWAPDTVSREFLNAIHNDSLEVEGAMRATAKVHVIRSSKTTKEIRADHVAQQNPSAHRKNEIFDYFMEALKEAGGPFASSAHPVVAGLILDSHYSASKDLILGHAALGCHNPKGISLGMFGSHLTYSWPRFLEEVTSCLTDTRSPGDKVGNDNGECHTMWEACTIGQGAHIHEVGHAFGSPHRPGIMERGYAQDWPKNFLSKTAYCGHIKKEGIVVNDSTPNNAVWNLSDALTYRVLPHFRLPTDRTISQEARLEGPQAGVEYDGEEDLRAILHIHCAAGLVRISFNGEEEKEPSLATPVTDIRYTEEDLESRFDRSEPLELSLLGYNGKEKHIENVWKSLAFKTFIRIPGTDIRLFKRGVGVEDVADRNTYEWAQLLKERGPDGRLHRAIDIDLRVGALWDGGVVKYEDGHKSHWGPMRTHGRPHSFGGHQSQTIEFSPEDRIKRIDVNCGEENRGYMSGISIQLFNGTIRGALNDEYGTNNIVRLEPSPQEDIVGFYGRSGKDGFCGVMEFGIITAPRSVGLNGLPEAAFNLSELKNTCGLEDGNGGQVR